MRLVKKYSIILLTVMCLHVVFTKNVCAADVPPKKVPVETKANVSDSTKKTEKKSKAKLNLTRLQIKVDKTKKLSVSNYDGKVKWSSSNKAVAKVSKDGVVTARTPGDAVIIAQAAKKQLKCRVRVVAQAKHIDEWVESRGRIFYFDKYGRKAVGKKKINGEEYYFDTEGRQRVGWVKLKGGYYYYNIGKKAKGYRVKGEVINGIRLKKTGEAKLTSKTQDKVRYLTAANELCFDYVDNRMSRKEALKKMYTLMVTGEIISYYNYGPFQYSADWDQYYASYYFERGIGDCYTTGCAFAYIATALGYEEVYAESSGGHGWCRIGERYFDPNWASWGAEDIYDGFAATEAKSGKDGRVNWMRACKYSKKVS